MSGEILHITWAFENMFLYSISYNVICISCCILLSPNPPDWFIFCHVLLPGGYGVA